MVICIPLSLANSNNSKGYGANKTIDNIAEEVVELYVKKYILSSICCFGIIGNILNLLVLTRRSLQNRMGNLERSANIGLCSMAVSDLFLCCILLPEAWIDQKQFSFGYYSFELCYKLYHNTLVNVFILTGTLLIVYIALQRYVAILQPIRARIVVRTKTSIVLVSLIWFMGIVLNIPRLFYEVANSMECVGNFSVFYLAEGFMKKHGVLSLAYEWSFSLFGIFAPLIILLYCNVHLIRALQTSTKMRGQFRNDNNRKERESTRRVTLTLVVIVISFIVLVVPTEIMKLLKEIGTQRRMTPGYNMLLAFANVGQSVNFAFNFILYCFVNPNFRNTLKLLLLPACLRKPTAILEESGETVKLTTVHFTNSTKCEVKEEKAALKANLKNNIKYER
ncbi:unnamed protein product [Dimorphilus gyrociliatus]|uniref:G-protein coupled receptors family 1 profile domain-containing protein n=1 Tax=Dimorphilus gyrociliatus TaxID=2664684 RepID=A0A7I8W558_9ANNE|nr:unnamed protein product [Dimorphilus gyrociliatus]